MEISSVNQARVFLWMVVCGAVCTLIFDIFRGIRRYKSAQCSVIMVQDLLLWSIEICIVYMVAFKLNYAKVRAYEFVALVIGAVLYFVLLSDRVVKTVCSITAIGVKIVMYALNPAVRFFKFATMPLTKLAEKLRKITVRIINGKKVIVSMYEKLRKLAVFKDKSVSESGIKQQKNS